MMLRRATLGALLFVGACKHGCRTYIDPPVDMAGSRADAEASTTTPTGLEITELGRGNDRYQGLAFDARYVHFGAILHGWRRVSKAGGPVEIVADGDPHGISDPRHAYFNDLNSFGNTPTRTHDSETEYFTIDASGVYRNVPAPKGPAAQNTIAPLTPDPSVGNIARSVLIVDDANVYWIGGGVSGLFSVPRAGGAVRKLCGTGAGSVVDDLVSVGDTLFVIDIDGTISSVKKSGGTLTLLDDISSKLGPNRNAIWAATDSNDLYIVSDATESMQTPTFDSRVVKVALPAH